MQRRQIGSSTCWRTGVRTGWRRGSIGSSSKATSKTRKDGSGMTRSPRWLLIVLAALPAPTLHAQTAVQVRMATVVPQGSLWDESLQYIRQEWGRISGGSVQVTIYAGGTQGDEAESVRKVTRGQLQAVALSSVGLSRIDSGIACLQLPLLFDSYAELDYVRDGIAAA